MTRTPWRSTTLVFLALALAGCGASVLPSIHSDSERLNVAKRFHDRGNCTQAIDLLKSYIASAAGTAEVDQAVFLLGSCYLKTKEWTLAQIEFERLLRDYPESDSSGSSAFLLGEALYGQTRPEDFDQEFTVKAIDQWQAYLRGYPDHWRIPEAERRVQRSRNRLAGKLVDTADLYLKLQLVNPARVYYQRVAEDFPDTTALADARIGLALCDARQGRRTEAIAALRDVESQFPRLEAAKRAAQERRRLERD